MEIGLATGLAQSMGFDQQIQDMRYIQEMMKRQQDMNAAKAKMFSDSLEFQNASNSFDAPKVRDMNAKIVQEIGDYIQSNPDWETNVQKMSYVKLLKNKLKDNPEVLRAVHSDNNYKELLKDLQEVAKNPNQHDQDAYNSYLSKWDNYLKFGNQDGEQAALAEGVKPFTYVKPKDFVNLSGEMLNIGKNINDFDVVPTKYGGYYTKPKEDQINALKNEFMQQHGRQIFLEAKKLGMTSPEEIDSWIKNGIMAGVKKDFKLGDEAKYWELGMRQKEMNMKHAEAVQKVKSANPNYTPWHYLTDDKNNPAGTISVDDFYKVWGSKLPVQITGTDGQKVDLSDIDFKPTGRVINQGGMTFINGYYDLPLDVAESKGLYQKGLFTIDGPTAAFRDDVKEVDITDKDGNSVKAVRVKYNMPINKNDKVAMQKFNVLVDVDKLVPPTQSPEQENLATGGGQQMFRIAGVDVPVGSKIRNKKTGQVGILQPDGSIK